MLLGALGIKSDAMPLTETLPFRQPETTEAPTKVNLILDILSTFYLLCCCLLTVDIVRCNKRHLQIVLRFRQPRTQPLQRLPPQRRNNFEASMLEKIRKKLED